MNRSNTIRSKTMAVLLLATALHATARAQDPGAASATASQASTASIAATGSVLVVGSLIALSTAGGAVVASVEAAGDGTVVVLRGVSDASTASVRIVGGASVAVGSLVEVVVLTTGCALMQAGRMIAFVPNAVGRALVHQRSDVAVR